MDRCIIPDGDFHTVHLLVEKLRASSPSPTSPESAAERVYIATQSTYLGDYQMTLWALEPYLVGPETEIRPNEEVLTQIQSLTTQADILIEIALLMEHGRAYESAVELVQRAIELYEGGEDQYGKANAYHCLSVLRFHQHDYQKSEKCELKRMELVYEQADRDKHQLGVSKEMELSYLVATCRMWLGVLAQKQGALAKAKAELYTARELLCTVAEATGKIRDLRVWGDFRSTLSSVYSSEGKYREALDQAEIALDFYVRATHTIFEAQTRIKLSRIYLKKMAAEDASPEDQENAKSQLDLAAEALAKRPDERTACLLNLTYSWYYYACRDWTLGENRAQRAVRDAKKLGSKFILAECYRTRAEAAIQLHKLVEARSDLEIAMKQAEAAGRYKVLAAVFLTFARTYCSHIEPNQTEVDKYLDRYLEVKAMHPFESKYLDCIFDKLKRDRLLLPSLRAFYFSDDDLERVGYDAGLSKYLTWAIGRARRTAHGDVKKMTEILRFKTLTRTYKYLKLARAVEAGTREAAEKINKTHTIHPRASA